MHNSLAQIICQGFLERIACIEPKPKKILDITGFLKPIYTVLQNTYPDIEILSCVDITDIAKFASETFDLVCCASYAADKLDFDLAQIRSILVSGGACLLQTLGPDSLDVGIDLHNLGDLLIHLGFVDPVVDVDFCDAVEIVYAYARASKAVSAAKVIATEVLLE